MELIAHALRLQLSYLFKAVADTILRTLKRGANTSLASAAFRRARGRQGAAWKCRSMSLTQGRLRSAVALAMGSVGDAYGNAMVVRD
jgi:hypothetical protein